MEGRDENIQEIEFPESMDYIPFEIKFSRSEERQIRKDATYTKDISKVMGLLTACAVIPNGAGGAEMQYTISDPVHRIELENYVMNLTRKNLDSVILVNQMGIKKRKSSK